MIEIQLICLQILQNPNPKWKQGRWKRRRRESLNFSQQGFSFSGELRTISGSILDRQSGQTECFDSHVSAHFRWNPWLHPGSNRTGSAGSISSKQTAHSDPRTNPLPFVLGSFCKSDGERPSWSSDLEGESKSVAWLAAYQRRQR